jgi:hypothetical protein|tara:strand:+ start:101 stop:313 length:213 start_codon:yes stop_codon:yes gene_type:complete
MVDSSYLMLLYFTNKNRQKCSVNGKDSTVKNINKIKKTNDNSRYHNKKVTFDTLKPQRCDSDAETVDRGT